MATCQLCSKEFKTEQGLAGHHQFKHAGQVAQLVCSHPDHAEQLAQQAGRAGLSEAQLAGLLEQVQEQLDELLRQHAEQVKSAAAGSTRIDRTDHSHGMSDPECADCIELVRKTLNTAEQEAMDEMARRYEAIPGVTLLRERWERLKANGKDPEEGLITFVDDKGDPIALDLEQIIRIAVRDKGQDLITFIEG